jgi:hypothetical protein
MDTPPKNAPPTVFRNLDELVRQMQLDEVEDAEYVTPVNYAKIRPKLTPQLVYYRIRTGKLVPYQCACGRKVIKIEEADKVFGFTNEEEETDGESE